MFNADTDLLFPARTIPALREARAGVWQSLVDSTVAAGLNSPDHVAFILMMARLNNCATCNADSFRALSGCTTCSKQSIKRYRGTDKELASLFEQTKLEVDLFLQNG